MRVGLLPIVAAIVLSMTGCVSNKCSEASVETPEVLEAHPISREIPANTVTTEGDFVVVTVYIDTLEEKLKGPRLEGTGMLRTSYLLRKEFPGLPKQYSVPSSVIKRKLDRKTGVYVHSTRFRLADVEKARLGK